jgi:hypothetical protein
MKTKTINIYSFEELSQESQEKAIEYFRNCKQNDGDLLMFFSDDVTEQLKEQGWNDVKLQYSLGCCQGDGLSFSGKLDLKWFLENKYSYKLPKYKVNALCEYIYSVHSKGNTGYYCYAGKNQIEYDENYQDNIERKNLDKLWQDVLSEIKTSYLALCRKFEKQGYDEIAFQLSDECIKEEIEANDYEFLENGMLA